MKSYLSTELLGNISPVCFFNSSFSLIVVLGLVSCSSIEPVDYSVKDSLYVWSDSFDDEIEVNQIETDYQSIRSLEESLLNNDVQLIFEEMIDHKIAEVDISLEKINQEIGTIQKKINEAGVGEDEVLSVQDFQIGSVEDINRITAETPTAAGIPMEQVLPEVHTNVAELETSTKILRLTNEANYQLDNTDYGMWHLVKSEDSAYKEICSLSSSTMQVELDNYSTQVWLRVVGTGLLVNSTTNIDVHRPRVGIKLDNGSLQPFHKSYFNTSAIWSGDLESILQNNKQLRINLSGNELGGRTQEVAVNLHDLTVAYTEYQKCNNGTQIGSL